MLSNPASRASATARPRPIGRVQPAQPLQLGVPKRLDTETHAVDARRSKPVHSLDVRRLGIGLERDFGVRFDLERLRGRRRSAGQSPAARGATASRRRNRRCRPARRDRPAGFPARGQRHTGPSGRVEQAAVEIAVVADGRTERNVEVEPQHDFSASSSRAVGSLATGLAAGPAELAAPACFSCART